MEDGATSVKFSDDGVLKCPTVRLCGRNELPSSFSPSSTPLACASSTFTFMFLTPAKDNSLYPYTSPAYTSKTFSHFSPSNPTQTPLAYSPQRSNLAFIMHLQPIMPSSMYRLGCRLRAVAAWPWQLS